jgi:hypothetical protein
MNRLELVNRETNEIINICREVGVELYHYDFSVPDELDTMEKEDMVVWLLETETMLYTNYPNENHRIKALIDSIINKQLGLEE